MAATRFISRDRRHTPSKQRSKNPNPPPYRDDPQSKNLNPPPPGGEAEPPKAVRVGGFCFSQLGLGDARTLSPAKVSQRSAGANQRVASRSRQCWSTNEAVRTSRFVSACGDELCARYQSRFSHWLAVSARPLPRHETHCSSTASPTSSRVRSSTRRSAT